MNDPTVAYTKPPTMHTHMTHTCSGTLCGYNNVEFDGDQYVCRDCGTGWADEDDRGQLYPEWSGEQIDAEPIDPDKTPPRPKGHV